MQDAKGISLGDKTLTAYTMRKHHNPWARRVLIFLQLETSLQSNFKTFGYFWLVYFHLKIFYTARETVSLFAKCSFLVPSSLTSFVIGFYIEHEGVIFEIPIVYGSGTDSTLDIRVTFSTSARISMDKLSDMSPFMSGNLPRWRF